MTPFGLCPLARRDWFRWTTGLWLGAPAVFAEDSSPNQLPGFGRAKTVLLIVANGGQSQLETWDPKPFAPIEVRGAFDSISTSIPGVQFSEHLPKLAQLAHRFATLRTLSHEDLDHGSALYLTLTGRYHNRRSSNPPPSPTDWPSCSAIVKRIQGVRRSLDAAVHVNGPALVPVIPGAGQNAGFLGADFDPLLVGDVTENTTALPGLVALPDVGPHRRDRRDDLLRQLELNSVSARSSTAWNEYAVLADRARVLLDQPAIQQAFEIHREPEAVRDRYGRDRSGQACLFARRMVEAGIPWITLFWNHSGRGQDLAPDVTTEYGWDTHNDIFHALRERLLPRFDQSLSTLLQDLDDRGLLNSTLVVVVGEFGRAPLVAIEKNFKGESPGRKHWSACYSGIIAGAGVNPGQVIGKSDRRGAYPDSEKFGPWDLAATMFSALGIDPGGYFTDRLGRPLQVADGRSITTLYH